MWIFKSDVHWTVLMKSCCHGSTSSLSFLFTQCRSSCSDDISFVRSLKSLKLFVLHPFAGAQRLPLISWVQPSAHLKWVRTQMGLMFARQTSIQPPTHPPQPTLPTPSFSTCNVVCRCTKWDVSAGEKKSPYAEQTEAGPRRGRSVDPPDAGRLWAPLSSGNTVAYRQRDDTGNVITHRRNVSGISFVVSALWLFLSALATWRETQRTCGWGWEQSTFTQPWLRLFYL